MQILNTLKLTLSGIIFLAIALFTMPATAEQSQRFDGYTVHYNTMNTEMLNAEVARGYKITRSKNRALLNISVLQDGEPSSSVKTKGTFHPVKAEVTATATNLSSQMREIKIRELEDAGAIYYIGEIPVRNEETLDFDVQVQPAGSEETYTLKFSQQFFTE